MKWFFCILNRINKLNKTISSLNERYRLLIINFITLNINLSLTYITFKSYIMKNQRSKKISYLTGIALVCLSLFSITTTTVQAQDVTATATENSFVVKGNVSDETGPLPGVNIILQGTNIGIATDINGDFEFPKKLKKGDVLVFSYLGLQPQKVVIKNEDSASKIDLNIDMALTEIVIVGEVATKKVYKSKNN